MSSTNGSYNFYPYFVCRVSGLPTNLVENLKSALLEKLAKNLLDELKKVEKYKFEISDKLFETIKTTNEKKLRSQFISLRRDIFNEKVDCKSIQVNILSEGLVNNISKLNNELNKKLVIAKELKENYYSEKKRIRNLFIDYLQDEDFQKGLLLSSKSLFTLQKLYHKNNYHNQDRKVEQIERGLLRYFTRTAMKATPFGTLCAIIPGKVNGAHNNFPLNFSNNPSRKKSLLLINKDIYGIISNYIRKDVDIRKKLSVELNKTIEKKETIFYFLTEINGREVFQRLNINSILELLAELFESDLVLIYEELINKLVSNEDLDATKEEVEAYIDKLIEIGFIRYKIGIPEQMVDWSTPLLDILRNTGTEKAKVVQEAIEKLKLKVNEYEVNDVKVRINNLEELAEILENTFKELNITYNIRSNLPLYEDATADAFADIDENYMNEIKNSLYSFIHLTQKLAYPRNEHANMRHFFDEHYKDPTVAISLLQFYEDYYREHFKSHLEKQQKAQYQKNLEELKGYDLNNPFGLKIIKELQNASKNISSLISKKWSDSPNAVEINITINELKAATDCVENVKGKNFSVSLFSQLIQSNINGEKARLIITNGHYLAGYGKYFSRFLYLFDSEVLNGIYENNSLTNGEILAEISGDANFNANLHPPLLKYEISYPTTEIGLAEVPLKCTDIIVEKDPLDSNRLKLKHRQNNSYVVPLDLGFLNSSLRPPLFQLLSKFSPPCNFSLQLPEKPVITNHNNNEVKPLVNEASESKQQEEKIIYRPRILFDNKIVLTRRNWFIPKGLLPQISNEEEDFEFFIRIHQWIAENNIPNEVYIKIRPLPLPANNNNQQPKQPEEKPKSEQIEQKTEETQQKEELKSEAKKETQPDNGKAKQTKFSRDYYKPQYIDFSNPLLVDLFGKMTVGLKNYLVTIEERYPGKEQLPSYDNQTFAVEQIFQIDYRRNDY